VPKWPSAAILSGMNSIKTPHFLIAGGRVRPRVSRGISNELVDHIAAELVPLGLVPDGRAFERIFVDAVLSARPDPERAWTDFYGNTLHELRRADPAGTGSVAAFARIYERALPLVRGTTVLDVGCCFGFLPMLAAERNPRLKVIGTDLVPATAALADQALDTVLAVHVLEHLPAGVTIRALAELCRVARRRVVVAVPLEEVPDPAFGHLQAFSLARLARLGADAPGWSHTVSAADGGWLVLDRAAHSPFG